MIQKVRKAVIPAAGLGTRFLPLTKAVPKELLPLVDKAAIQYVVEEAVEAGIEHVVIIIAPGKETISGYFRRNPSLEGILATRQDYQHLVHQQSRGGQGNCRTPLRDSQGSHDPVYPSRGSGLGTSQDHGKRDLPRRFHDRTQPAMGAGTSGSHRGIPGSDPDGRFW